QITRLIFGGRCNGEITPRDFISVAAAGKLRASRLDSAIAPRLTPPPARNVRRAIAVGSARSIAFIASGYNAHQQLVHSQSCSWTLRQVEDLLVTFGSLAIELRTVERQRNNKCRAYAGFAFDRDLAAVRFNYGFADRKSQPRSPCDAVTGPCFVNTEKAIK